MRTASVSQNCQSTLSRHNACLKLSHCLLHCLVHCLVDVVFLAIITITLLLTPASWASNPAVEQNIEQAQTNKIINLKLTYMTYKLVLADYLQADKPAQDTLDYQYNYNRQLLNVFFAEWELLIESGMYKSTREIFFVLHKYYPFFNKYFPIYDSKFSPDSNQLLPFERSSFLGSVISSESIKDPYQRALKLIDDVNLFLILPETNILENKPHLGMTLLLLISSLNVENQLTSKAKSYLSKQNWNKTVAWLSTLKTFFENGGVRGAGQLGYKVGYIATKLGSGILNTAGKAAAKNPLAAALVASGLAHLTFFYLAEDVQKKLGQMSFAASENNSENTIAVFNLLEVFELYVNKIFYSNIEQRVGRGLLLTQPLKSKQQLLLEADQYLNNKFPNFNYLNFFLQAEKTLAIYPENEGEQKNLDLSIALANNLKNEIALIKPSSDMTAIKSFMQIVFNRYLASYKRDERNLTSLFLGFGGNCVSRTVLILSLLQEFPELLPNGAKIYLGIYSDHFEPMLHYNGQYYSLVFGWKQNSTRALLYEPKTLVYLVSTVLRSENKGVSNLYNQLPQSMTKNATNIAVGNVPAADYSTYGGEFKEADENYKQHFDDKKNKQAGEIEPSNKLEIKYETPPQDYFYSGAINLHEPFSTLVSYSINNLNQSEKTMIYTTDYDAYITLKTKQTTIAINPTPLLTDIYNDYWYKRFSDPELINFLQNDFANLNFIRSPFKLFGETSESKQQSLIRKIRNILFFKGYASNFYNDALEYLKINSSNLCSAKTYSFIFIFANDTTSDSKHFCLSNSIADQQLDAKFKKLEKIYQNILIKFLTSVQNDTAKFINSLDNVDEIQLKLIRSMLPEYLGTPEEFMKQNDYQTPRNRVELAKTIMAEPIKKSVDRLKIKVGNQSSSGEGINLPVVHSAKTWRWGPVSDGKTTKQEATATEKSLVLLLWTTHSGLNLWNQDLMKRYLQLSNANFNLFSSRNEYFSPVCDAAKRMNKTDRNIPVFKKMIFEQMGNFTNSKRSIVNNTSIFTSIPMQACFPQ